MFLLLPGRVGSSSSPLGLSEHHPGCEGQGCSFSPHVASTDTEVGGWPCQYRAAVRVLASHSASSDTTPAKIGLAVPVISGWQTSPGSLGVLHQHWEDRLVTTGPIFPLGLFQQPPPTPGVRGYSISLQSGGGESRALHLDFAGLSGGGAQFFSVMFG